MNLSAAELRDLFNDESIILDGGMAPGLTSSSPPLVNIILEHVRPDDSKWYEVVPEKEPADQIGQSLSATMVSLIGGVESDGASYGPRWPVRRALEEWERSCRRRHRPTSVHWRDHKHGPLCSDLLRAASVGVSLLWCSQTFGVEYPRAERLLNSGLRFVGERIARWQDDQLGILHDRDRCEVCRAEALET